MVDSNTVKCQDCGYTFICEVDDDAGDITFKSGEPHFDSRKYTCDPSWMKQWEKSGWVSKITKFFVRVRKFLRNKKNS